MKLIPIAAIAAITLSACAPQPGNVEAAYVSPDNYRGKSCATLIHERNEVVREVNSLTSRQQKAADADAALVGVGVLLLWPVLLAPLATPAHANALADAKGRYDALTARMGQAGCA